MTLLRFGCTGGAPPPLFELLVVNDDGSVDYLVRQPSPARPPLDEIGLYRLAPDQSRAAEVKAALEAGGSFPESARLPFDSPAEGIVVGERRVTWHPSEVPVEMAGLVEAVFELAAEARASPYAALLATLAAESKLVLQLTARGAAVVRFGAPDAPDPALRLAARISLVPPAEPEPDATALVRLDPLELGTGRRDWTELSPGSELRIELPAAVRQRPARVDGLVSVMWETEGGEPQDGWLRPASVEMR